jgi:hypothetical protein
MVGEYVLSRAHNSSFTPEFATFFCPSYFTTQEVSVGPWVFAIRQVIQTDGLVSSLSPITRVRKARAIMHNLFVLSTRKKNAPCWRRGRRLLHHKVLGHQILVSQEYMYIRKTYNFPLINLWSANFKCVK